MSTYDPIALGVTVGLDAIRADAAAAPAKLAQGLDRALADLTQGILAALQTLAQDGAE